eukprot:gnl/MRDRNA2_/MRDRNA2_132751_c0_seq1.p1 gnl/MRDRNA2_/MRDRNA2_132751_c0~~gnl/MRDRNA2_/MRDRNA2_132751_c0_seq1.p1  ORF type:complete len:252 (-),score=41.35 gnl/MRDRNA2_/MRDRNA2_132751_c0_seq1:98-853(-)
MRTVISTILLAFGTHAFTADLVNSVNDVQKSYVRLRQRLPRHATPHTSGWPFARIPRFHWMSSLSYGLNFPSMVISHASRRSTDFKSSELAVKQNSIAAAGMIQEARLARNRTRQILLQLKGEDPAEEDLATTAIKETVAEYKKAIKAAEAIAASSKILGDSEDTDEANGRAWMRASAAFEAKAKVLETEAKTIPPQDVDLPKALQEVLAKKTPEQQFPKRRRGGGRGIVGGRGGGRGSAQFAGGRSKPPP